ncbi:MAG: hypothetical protein WDN28_17060 [Chthoniobacter sp.]
MAVFCLLENTSYAQWLQSLSGPSGIAAASDPHPTPAEVTQAVDVLGLLRQVAPQQTFALAGDSELKLRALRNPWCRVKAMQIYGLNLGDGAVPPDLGQLLHTKPGGQLPHLPPTRPHGEGRGRSLGGAPTERGRSSGKILPVLIQASLPFVMLSLRRTSDRLPFFISLAEGCEEHTR